MIVARFANEVTGLYAPSFFGDRDRFLPYFARIVLGSMYASIGD